MTEPTPLDPHLVGERSAALWRYLSEWLARDLDPPAADARGIVSQDDACRALLLSALAIQRTVEQRGGQLDGDVAGSVLSMLLLARDYVRPLPDPEPLPDGTDSISRDLQSVVDNMRAAEIDARGFHND